VHAKTSNTVSKHKKVVLDRKNMGETRKSNKSTSELGRTLIANCDELCRCENNVDSQQ
jgi:hypothetical protein